MFKPLDDNGFVIRGKKKVFYAGFYILNYIFKLRILYIVCLGTIKRYSAPTSKAINKIYIFIIIVF